MREYQHVLNRNRIAAARFCEPFHSLENFSELYPGKTATSLQKLFLSISVLYIVPAYGNVILMLLAKSLLT